ncbi:hypothetical protein CDCA_CDCA05G1614 [Cyanidium caldarium]|uniref:60S ribosomal protein L31 n=1 Tax=Cyanidium caldarium TaxID=2771 RepID=A0AAV9ITH4_CYACA|nr:hypothetical protein CDCA_CDCA05G1614 [Cyanidium caldarium]
MVKSTRVAASAAEKSAVTREYTIKLHKHLSRVGFKRRAPRAIKAVREFARRAMGTPDVRITEPVNKEIWKRGIRGTPFRIRVRLLRKRNDAEKAKEPMYTEVELVPVSSFKGLLTVKVD